MVEGPSAGVHSLSGVTTRVSRDFWVNRAIDSELPLWLRIGFAALAWQGADGHAPLEDGFLAEFLGSFAKHGPGKIPANRLSEAMKRAKEKGWVGRESNSRCLIVGDSVSISGNSQCSRHGNNNGSLHCLYRFFDCENQLLYVGITADPGSRIKNHISQKGWWLEVASTTYTHFQSREQLKAAEIMAIRSEMPKYNISHNL